MTDETGKPRVSGEAAWKAAREAMDQRNAATKRRAQEHLGALALAAVERERRLELAEAAQLRALNERLRLRPPGNA